MVAVVILRWRRGGHGGGSRSHRTLSKHHRRKNGVQKTRTSNGTWAGLEMALSECSWSSIRIFSDARSVRSAGRGGGSVKDRQTRQTQQLAKDQETQKSIVN